MKIDISGIPVMEFEVLAFMLQCKGWFIQISCDESKGQVWAKMDKPLIDASITPVQTYVCMI
jgi:hypothetical protein